MHTYLDCVACLVRQSVDAVKIACTDEDLQKQVLTAVLEEASHLDFSNPPPVLAGRIHRVIRETSGVADPYLAIKRQCNRAALDRVPALREHVAASPDPFATAARIAMAGNVLDFGVLREGDELGVDEALADALTADLAVNDLERLREAAAGADDILYLADNSGEIVFDRLFLERLPRGKVTVAVKGGPIINDATLDDARDAGVSEADLISSGSRYPGTLLDRCSDAFVKRFEEAGLIVAKGQANYESLSAAARSNIFFLLKVKCPMISRDLGFPVGSWVVKEHRPA